MKRFAAAAAAAVLAGLLLVTGAVAVPGDLDPSFGDSGTVVDPISPGAGDDLVNGLVIQPDGRHVIAGSAHDGTTEDFMVARYTKRGEVDTAFGIAGNAVTEVSAVGNDHAFALVRQPDGNLVAAGLANMGAGAGGRNFALVRYLPNGSLDTSFGADGIVAHGRAGLITCDCSTVSPGVTVDVHDALAGKGIHHMDTPMLGSQPQAVSGEIFFIVGGDPGRVEAIAPYLKIMGKLHMYVGGPGMANRVKLAHNGLAAAVWTNDVKKALLTARAPA